MVGVHLTQSQKCCLLMLNDREGTNSGAAAYGLFFLPSLCGHHLAPQPESRPGAFADV